MADEGARPTPGRYRMPNENTPTEPEPPLGLLLCRDLIFTTKVRDTAAALGVRIEVVGREDRARAILLEKRPRVVFVDLTAGDLVTLEALQGYRKLAGPDVWFTAFGPHVDVDRLDEARAAGCQAVMPRSRFAARLVDLIAGSFLGAPGGD